MVGFQRMKTAALAVSASALLAGCGTGMVSKGSFDRTYTVSGPLRLELANASGAVRITGTSENTVRIHGEVSARSFLLNDTHNQAPVL